MSAFELNSKEDILHNKPEKGDCLDPKRLRQECIIALKVYDSCRAQDCLTRDIIGPARAAECVTIGNECIKEGDIIIPPSNAAAVTMDRLRVKRIIIIEKEPNPFKNGFWDVDLKFVFEYRLTFREADGCPISHPIRANSIFNKKVTLFGSLGSDLVIATDLLQHGDSTTLDAEPFILAEAKAVALCSELIFSRRKHCGDYSSSTEPSEVGVTIGLFSMIKLFRIVDLSVESRGFCIPCECEEVCTSPCDFFDSLDFPMDVFAPPQKPEFIAGISSNISSSSQLFHDKKKCCGC